MFKEIRPDNVIMFAMKHYSNPQGDTQTEFNEDMKRFKYIKRLLRKYDDTGDLKERLILNHIIVLNNVLVQKVVQHYCCSNLKEIYGNMWNHLWNI